jgi:hypothetical protein
MTSCIEEGKDLIAGKGSNFVRIPAASTELNNVGLRTKCRRQNCRFSGNYP